MPTNVRVRVVDWLKCRADFLVPPLTTSSKLSISSSIFSRGYKIQPSRYGMTAGEFKDLLNVADYSKAKGCAVEDITKHSILESIGDRKYLVKIGRGCVQSESGPFFLDLAHR